MVLDFQLVYRVSGTRRRSCQKQVKPTNNGNQTDRDRWSAVVPVQADEIEHSLYSQHNPTDQRTYLEFNELTLHALVMCMLVTVEQRPISMTGPSSSQ